MALQLPTNECLFWLETSRTIKLFHSKCFRVVQIRNPNRNVSFHLSACRNAWARQPDSNSSWACLAHSETWTRFDFVLSSLVCSGQTWESLWFWSSKQIRKPFQLLNVIFSFIPNDHSQSCISHSSRVFLWGIQGKNDRIAQVNILLRLIMDDSGRPFWEQYPQRKEGKLGVERVEVSELSM
jgi:hypothetical protein